MAQQRFGVLDGVVLYGAISMVSLLATRRREDQAYYVKLDKPEWSPPPWLFGVVWPVLNAIQVSSDLTLMNEPRDPARQSLLTLRGANWVLYSLYSAGVLPCAQSDAGAGCRRGSGSGFLCDHRAGLEEIAACSAEPGAPVGVAGLCDGIVHVDHVTQRECASASIGGHHGPCNRQRDRVHVAEFQCNSVCSRADLCFDGTATAGGRKTSVLASAAADRPGRTMDAGSFTSAFPGSPPNSSDGRTVPPVRSRDGRPGIRRGRMRGVHAATGSEPRRCW